MSYGKRVSRIRLGSRNETKSRVAASRSIAVVLLCACATVLPSEATAQDESPVAAEVESLLKDFDRALNAMDLDETMAYYSDVIVILPPNEAAVVGKAAVRAWTEATFATYVVVETHRPEETLDFGDIVLHRGNATGSLTPRDGGAAIVFDNKYIHVFRRDSDGRLRMIWGVFNANPSE